MSKQKTRNPELLLRTFLIPLMICGSATLFADQAIAQGSGYLIFEPAKQQAEAAPAVVSAKEAFTAPNARLPKSQFGSFNNVKTSGNAPQLNGSKAIGTYASQDGRDMFAQPPNPNAPGARKLSPFASNPLLGRSRPEPDESTNDAAPIPVDDFPESTRRVPPRQTAIPNGPVTRDANVSPVAFQEGGFSPPNRSRQNPRQNRFGQRPPANGLSQQAAPSATRFGNNTSATQQTLPPRNTQPTQQPLRAAAQSRTGFSQGLPNQNPTVQRNRNGVGGLPPRPAATQRPAARTAALPQRPGQLGQGQRTPPATSSPKTGIKAARELLTNWAKEDSQLKLPGKRLTLREFLAQPINGSRKDAINQYWITFNDMANHKIAVEQSQWLASITNLRQPTDQAVLKAAQQSATNRILHTEIQLAKSQAMLQDYLPNFRYKTGKAIPVLPANIPWVGKLNTMYKEYQSRGMVPQKFNGIDEYLPKSRQLITDRAEAVAASAQAADQAKQALMQGQTPVSNVLEVARMKAKNQQDFLATVTGYNRAITDYVLTVRQDIFQPDRLATVLIGRKAVQGSIAKNIEKPEQDFDVPENSSLNPRTQQVSSVNNLQGESAYQGSSDLNARGIQSLPTSNASSQSPESQRSKSPFSTVGTSGQAKATTQKFDYGPSARSAKQANFDPSKVRAELPMQQTKQSGGNTYDSNTAAAGSSLSARSASTAGGLGQNPAGNRRSFTRPDAASGNRSVENRSTLPNRNGATQNPSTGGRLGRGFGGGNPIGNNSPTTFSKSSAPSSTTPAATPPVTSPFKGTTGPPTGEAVSRPLGGGRGATGQQPAAAPKSRFSDFGSGNSTQ